jgi:hypothetical protein
MGKRDTATTVFYVLFVLVGAFVLWTQIRRVQQVSNVAEVKIQMGQAVECHHARYQDQRFATFTSTIRQFLIEVNIRRTEILRVTTDSIQRASITQAIFTTTEELNRIPNIKIRSCGRFK